MGARDKLLLVITRVPCAYGVPIGAFLLAACGCAFAYCLTYNHDLIARVLSCGGAFLVILFVMQRLTAWEPKWFSILSGWAWTRAPVLLARATRRHGGTTFIPLPDGINTYADMRDYVG